MWYLFLLQDQSGNSGRYSPWQQWALWGGASERAAETAARDRGGDTHTHTHTHTHKQTHVLESSSSVSSPVGKEVEVVPWRRL